MQRVVPKSNSKKVTGSNPVSVRTYFTVEFPCSPHASVGFLKTPASFHSPKNMLFRFIGDSNLPLDMGECVGGCLVSVCGPAIGWRSVQGVTCLLTNIIGQRLLPPTSQ